MEAPPSADADMAFERDSWQAGPGSTGGSGSGDSDISAMELVAADVDLRQYLRSQIVFAVKTGAWPTDLIDHENGNSLDDRGDNLRPATQMQNAWNHKGRAKASLLPMGVRATRSGRYQARIQVDKKPKVVGVFDTPDAAQAAYQLARKEHFGDYA
jgi:type V secretory pathway adhesin AidA